MSEQTSSRWSKVDRKVRLVRQHFKHEASYWDAAYKGTDFISRVIQTRQAKVLELAGELPLHNNARVLEVGSGFGVTIVELAQRGHTVETVDIIEEMLDLTMCHAAEAHVLEKISLSLGDVGNLQFAGNIFDLVLAVGVLDWLSYPRTAIKELIRVAQPGGYIIVTFGNSWRLNYIFDPLFNPVLGPVRSLAKRILPAIGIKISQGERAKKEFVSPEREVSQRPPSYMRSLKEISAYMVSEGAEPIRVVAVGFGHFSFFGKRILSDALGLYVHEKLQCLADRNIPGINKTGRVLILLARKN